MAASCEHGLRRSGEKGSSSVKAEASGDGECRAFAIAKKECSGRVAILDCVENGCDLRGTGSLQKELGDKGEPRILFGPPWM